MKVSLRTKLSLSYVILVLVSVLLVSVITNLLLEKHFREYVIENQERRSRDIVDQVSKLYAYGEDWDLKAIESICVNALEQGLIIKVMDSSGNTVWDARLHNNERCDQILSHMERNMNSRYPNWQGGLVENSYPVFAGTETVGKVTVSYYGPYFFSDSDLEFINSMNRFLVIIGLFSLLMSFLFGSVMAKRMSKPILRVINTARMISEGDYGSRITEKTETKEIDYLTETINNLAESLEKQENLRKRLTADVAHELRTPLATLQSHIEAMIDGIWEPGAERLKSCHEEIVRISRLVGDLEKLARIESENLVLDRSEFDVSELVKNMIQNFENEFTNKGIKIIFSGTRETIVADKDKISQVIVNLLSNALKYTQKGGTVLVNVTGNEDNVNISVKDTGTGIPPEDLPYIFERFYRADKSRNRLTGGAGIGLTIAKAIVDAHGGNIQVNSKVGKGTEFVVSLPRHD